MEFCPTCGTRLQELEKKGVTGLLACLKCGYNRDYEQKAPYAKPLKTKEGIITIDREKQKLRTLPTVNINCSRCGNRRAYAWQIQTREIDRSSTQFFRCTKCGHTFREES